jgi:hypothetical protein
MEHGMCGSERVSLLQAGCVLTVEALCNIDGWQACRSAASIHVTLTRTHGKFMAICEGAVVAYIDSRFVKTDFVT